jgi:hypothetical protein
MGILKKILFFLTFNFAVISCIFFSLKKYGNITVKSSAFILEVTLSLFAVSLFLLFLLGYTMGKITNFFCKAK